ncbi:MAG: hypothetical protein A2Y86_01585 [Candidatus Aminicenantes bacterium RBG_13_62_12]|nr:MAG: hypothetical protein A2Y86_01585 [Candidatus Aminicenantes bacterium RBG_13_62_12]
MRTGWRARLAQARFVRKAVENPVDPGIFKKKPSPRFFAGLGLIVFSYLLAWPLIILLGVIAARRRQPALFAVGSPLAYGVSNLVFFLGAWLAGKEGLVYMRAGTQWLIVRFYKRYLAQPPGSSPHK